MVNPILLRKGVKSMLGVPLLDGETVLGVLHVGNLHSRAFTADDIAVLQGAADRVAGAIVPRRTYVDREAAKSLQRSLAPRRLPVVRRLPVRGPVRLGQPVRGQRRLVRRLRPAR